jgi:hypothetical protein
MKNIDEKAWIESARPELVSYIKRSVEECGDIGRVPAFHIAPIIAVWAVESKKHPGMVGFWAFSGDIPGDVITRDWLDKKDNPRKALNRMITIWKGYLPHLEIGDSPPGINMGIDGKQRKDMAGLLGKRIEIFSEMVNDDSIWDDDCGLH